MLQLCASVSVPVARGCGSALPLGRSDSHGINRLMYTPCVSRLFRMRSIQKVIVLTLCAFLGCSGAVDPTEREAEALGVYLTKDVTQAERAMLDLEAYLLHNSKVIEPTAREQGLAAVYSRLYAINHYLGRESTATNYYKNAAFHAGKVYKLRKIQTNSEDPIGSFIDGIDRHWSAQWRSSNR